MHVPEMPGMVLQDFMEALLGFALVLIPPLLFLFLFIPVGMEISSYSGSLYV